MREVEPAYPAKQLLHYRAGLSGVQRALVGTNTDEAGEKDEDFGKIAEAETPKREIGPDVGVHVIHENHPQSQAAEEVHGRRPCPSPSAGLNSPGGRGTHSRSPCSTEKTLVRSDPNAGGLRPEMAVNPGRNRRNTGRTPSSAGLNVRNIRTSLTLPD